MDFIELKTEEEIKHIISSHWHADNDAYLSPVFHGTDSSMFSILTQERKQIEEACDYIISELVRLYNENAISITDKRLMNSRDDYSNAGDALVKAQARINKSEFYNYDYYFVTNNPRKAIGYSNHAWICGESGWVANRLLEAAREIDLTLPDNDQFNRGLYLIDKRKQLIKDPMVLILVDVDSTGVCLENGIELKPSSDTDRFSIKIKSVKSHNTVYSLRLKKSVLERMDCIYSVKKENYDKLMDAWMNMPL